ncbi:hypothetical protein SASPL_105727 [Salvia splendens]|uniref:Uncharacterized protein n=1 Tax=Salvia splendens TaxID=180675 RepID=A0A8X8YQ62_SALSN|nr:hypothetical protein SASPL_105727 [Salvia splendens]
MSFDADTSYCIFNIPGAANRATRKKLHVEDDERTLENLKKELKPLYRAHASKSKNKAREIKSGTKVQSSLSKCKGKSSGKDDENVSLKRRKVGKKTAVNMAKTSKKQPSLGVLKDNSTIDSSKESDKADDKDEILRKSKRRRKNTKNNMELDDASRLQRRTRYLLIKVKLEQNLIDAYSTEGWKGQSREKIKPEKELQRAKQQILKCKLGAPDGSMHHEHVSPLFFLRIICVKCKLCEALPDNGIIHCHGTCHFAFHQKCMDPPLSPENSELNFCCFLLINIHTFTKKTEILEATNAHLGTHFPLDSNWQDVFKEGAALPDGVNSVLFQEEEWPSDDSADDDYDPDRNECSCSGNMSMSKSDASQYSSSFLGSLEDEDGRFEVRSNRSFDETLELIGVDSDEIHNGGVVSHPRQRPAVDYIELYNEMFGKNPTESKQISEDEDRGPTKRKRKAKETNAANTLMTLGETDNKFSVETLSDLKEKQLTKKMKRPTCRLPHVAVEKLRLVFSENELPERAVRVSLSEQLGLELEKSSHIEGANEMMTSCEQMVQECALPSIESEKASKPEEQKLQAALVFKRNPNQILKRVSGIKSHQGTMSVDLGDDVSLKNVRDKAKEAKKKLDCKIQGGMLEAENEMQRLCEIKSRVEKLHQLLLELPCSRIGKARGNNSAERSVLFVPIAELKERR